jgi:murein hydrolase activator
MLKLPLLPLPRRLAAGLGAGLLLSGLLVLSLPSHADANAENAAKLQALKESIEQLKKDLESTKDKRADVLKNLEQNESKIGELNKKAKSLEEQLNNTQSQLLKLRDEQEALSLLKKQQQLQVAQHLNSAYRLGQQSHVKLLLNQRDPQLIARQFKYLDYVVAARSRDIANTHDTLNRLARVAPAIAQEQAQLIKTGQSLRQQQAALKAQRAERQQLLRTLEASITSQDEALQAKEADQKRLQRLIETVVRVAGDFHLPINTRKMSALKGQLPWPAAGRVSHAFNSPRIGGLRWQGWVIDAPANSPVRAVHHGRVVFADYLRGQGLLVILDHGQGLLSLYAHNQTLYKSLGEWVNGGDVIATVGNSGGQTDTGLYFEIRERGAPTDPRSWLKKSA